MNERKKCKIITVHLPEGLVEGLNRMVREGYYPSRSEAIRVAVRELIKRHYKLLSKKNRLTTW